MKTDTIPGTYGNAQTPCNVLTYQNRNGSTWYAVEGGRNVNLSPDPLEPGIDVETIPDIDTATSNEPIETEQQLANFIEN